MKIGWAYMAIAALLVIFGAFIGFGDSAFFGIGDVMLLISIPLIYHGSNKLADERKAEEEAAE